MQAARFALALLALGSVRAETASHSTAPSYSIASIVNSASNTPGALAPNSIATIYGNDLSYNTRQMGLRTSAPEVCPRCWAVFKYMSAEFLRTFTTSLRTRSIS